MVENNKPSRNYMFKVNNRNTNTRCKICLKLTKKTPELRHWHHSGVFIVNFEHIFTLLWCIYCWIWAGKFRLGIRNQYNYAVVKAAFYLRDTKCYPKRYLRFKYWLIVKMVEIYYYLVLLIKRHWSYTCI